MKRLRNTLWLPLLWLAVAHSAQGIEPRDACPSKNDQLCDVLTMDQELNAHVAEVLLGFIEGAGPQHELKDKAYDAQFVVSELCKVKSGGYRCTLLRLDPKDDGWAMTLVSMVVHQLVKLAGSTGMDRLADILEFKALAKGGCDDKNPSPGAESNLTRRCVRQLVVSYSTQPDTGELTRKRFSDALRFAKGP